MAKALENDLPDGLTKLVSGLIILPDGPSEFLFRERWPDVRTAETSLVGRRVFTTYVIGLKAL